MDFFLKKKKLKGLLNILAKGVVEPPPRPVLRVTEPPPWPLGVIRPKEKKKIQRKKKKKVLALGSGRTTPRPNGGGRMWLSHPFNLKTNIKIIIKNKYW
jgi:hypothetical protein